MITNIDERMCVNDNVVQMGSEIMNLLKNNLKTAKTYISKERNKIIKKGNFIYNTKGKLAIETFNVKYIAHLYDNEKKYFDDYNDGSIDLDCECDFEEGLIILKVAEINNVLTKESIGNIEHELNHMLQCSYGQKLNETLYDKIVEQCYNGFGLWQKIAYALYLSFKTEIASFAVQYYTFLKRNNVPLYDIFNSFSNDENNPYNNFLSHYNCVLSNESIIFDEEVRSKFGITKHELLKRLENAKKRYKSKMMKVIMKYRDDVNDAYAREKMKKKHIFLEIHQLPFMRRQNFLWECYDKGIHDEASEYE